MKKEPDRKQFAAVRPIPPFGAIIKWFSDVLKLEDPSTYFHGGMGAEERRPINIAINILKSRTTEYLAAGEIVREDTKKSICNALTTLLRALPQLPIEAVPQNDLQEVLFSIWAGYDHLCEILSSFPDHTEILRHCLLRQLSLDLAIRAAAIAEMCGAPAEEESLPIWSKHAELTKHLKKLFGVFSSLEAGADAMHSSRNEVNRWLNELDTPPPSAISIWDDLLHQSPKLGITFGKYHLWRLYVGRAIYSFGLSFLPKEFLDELLKQYCRVKRKIRFHLSQRKINPDDSAFMIRFLMCVARIPDPLLAADLLHSETDLLWRRHLEASCHVQGLQTMNLSALVELYANAAYGHEQASKLMGIKYSQSTFYEGFRYSLEKTDKGKGPLADTMRLLENVQRKNSPGVAEKARLLESYLEANPTSDGAWDAVGRAHQEQGQYAEAEHCFRNAIHLNPEFLDHRTDLAFLLTKMARPNDALVELEKCSPEHKATTQWKFVCGRALLLQGRPSEAKSLLLECVKEPYKFGVAYLWLAESCEALGEDGKEFRKRAAELGVIS